MSLHQIRHLTRFSKHQLEPLRRGQPSEEFKFKLDFSVFRFFAGADLQNRGTPRDLEIAFLLGVAILASHSSNSGRGITRFR
jgi:hypothetical protein